MKKTTLGRERRKIIRSYLKKAIPESDANLIGESLYEGNVLGCYFT
jgi:hypothetical protein